MSELLREVQSVRPAAPREAENGAPMDTIDDHRDNADRNGVDREDATRGDADVTLTVLDAFMTYEKALMDNDVATMDAFFLPAASVVRFGVAEEQWGIEQVRAWRATATAVPAGRRLSETRVALHGRGTAIVTTLFRYPDCDRLGRQTQVWVNQSEEPSAALRPESWRIVSAHVSERSEGEQ